MTTRSGETLLSETAGLWIAAILSARPEIRPADRVALYLAYADGPNEHEIADAIGQLLDTEGADIDKFLEKGRRAFHALDVSASARSRWSAACNQQALDVDPVEAFIELGVIWHALSRNLRRSAEANRTSSTTSLAPAP